MSVTLTYDSQLSRVRITATGLGNADTALIERSTNQVTWSTVRGGLTAAVSSGALTVPVDDYEFVPGVVNYYRVTRAADIAFVAAGASTMADNTNLTPALPAGHTAGDLLLLWAAIHNSGTGNPNTPTGYTLLLNASNARLFGKIDSGSESAPTVSFTGGAAGPVGAQMAAFRNVPLSVNQFAAQLNGVTANVDYPALDVTTVHSLVLYLCWAKRNWASAATITGSGGTAVEIGDFTNAFSGVGQSQAWDYVIQDATDPVDIPAGQFVVTGGPTSISRGAVLSIPANLHQQSSSITPTLSGMWLKSVARPFLNTQVESAGFVHVTRRARNGVFQVVGRSLPVGVTDVRGGRELLLRLKTETAADRDRLDLFTASGDPVFLHVPPNLPISSMYAVVGDVENSQIAPMDQLHFFDLPLTEVAAPEPDVVGATSTYQSVLNTYATYSALLAGESTYADVIQNIGAPSDVIVP